MDDVLVGRNDGGKITAPILFKESQSEDDDVQLDIDDMQGFDTVLVFVTGKVRGGGDGDGGTGNINTREVFLTEENGYTVTLPFELIGEFMETEVNTARIRYSIGTDDEGLPQTITITKAAALTAVGTHRTAFALVSEPRIVDDEVIPGWAEVFRVTIIITVPLSVQHGNTTARHGETLVVNLTAPNYSPQYLQVRGSRPWVLEGVDTAIITVSPTSGNGFQNTWDAAWVMIARANSSTVSEIIATTFRILTRNQGTPFHWVDVIVNILPLISGRFVDPLPGEEGATGTEPVYIYI